MKIKKHVNECIFKIIHTVIVNSSGKFYGLLRKHNQNNKKKIWLTKLRGLKLWLFLGHKLLNMKNGECVFYTKCHNNLRFKCSG